jgi:hypothetical protein
MMQIVGQTVNDRVQVHLKDFSIVGCVRRITLHGCAFGSGLIQVGYRNEPRTRYLSYRLSVPLTNLTSAD